jgi:hypothetical protein
VFGGEVHGDGVQDLESNFCDKTVWLHAEVVEFTGRVGGREIPRVSERPQREYSSVMGALGACEPKLSGYFRVCVFYLHLL